MAGRSRRRPSATELLLLFGLLLGGIVSAAGAGEYNEVLSPGDKAPEWTDLPGTDGKRHSSADFKDKEILVVVFTCNSCPVAEDYEDRLVALAEKYGGAEGKVGVVAINVNRVEADSLPRMKERAEKKKFPFVYVYDETQKIARDFGAMYTPEFFVLDRDRKVVYQGGMDDNSRAEDVKQQYVVPAIEAALAGKTPAVRETLARGCRIRFLRSRG